MRKRIEELYFAVKRLHRKKKWQPSYSLKHKSQHFIDDNTCIDGLARIRKEDAYVTYESQEPKDTIDDNENDWK